MFIHDAVCEVLRQKVIQEQPEDEHIYGNEAFNPEENLYENTKFEGNVCCQMLFCCFFFLFFWGKCIEF